jgi:hypothetical protein
MRICVTAPSDQMSEYLAIVVDQYENDCTCGHHDQDTYWEIDDFEDGE